MLESKVSSNEKNQNSDLSIPELFQNLLIRIENVSPSIRMLMIMLFMSLIGIGGYFFSNANESSASSVEEKIPFASNTASTLQIDAPLEKIMVHVVGEIQYPGIFEMESDSRISEIIDKAGGVTSEADIEQLNLAAFVSDGSQIRVPKRGGDVVGPLVLSSSPNNNSTNGGTVVNINRATSGELESLTGVGPSLASKIIKYRDTNGSFASVDSLLSVPGIGPAKLESMREFVVL